jgi:hypothetical protein
MGSPLSPSPALPLRIGSAQGCIWSAFTAATSVSTKRDMVIFGATARDGDMAYDTPPPKKVPEPGYYYHFKHDPDGPVNNYAYYIYGVGHHTEDDCRAEDAFMQVYRPLYEEAYAYRNGGLFDLRPLQMFFSTGRVEGKRGAAVHQNRQP